MNNFLDFILSELNSAHDLNLNDWMNIHGRPHIFAVESLRGAIDTLVERNEPCLENFDAHGLQVISAMITTRLGPNYSAIMRELTGYLLWEARNAQA